MDAVEMLRRSPRATGIFLDFDGTLSHIVPVAADARPAEGVHDLLQALGKKYAVVAVISGRSAHELLEWLGPDIEIWGTHGAQRTADGRVVLSPQVESYQALMAEVRKELVSALAELRIDGAFVEDKGIMLALHWRAADDSPETAARIAVLANEFAARRELVLWDGAKTIELRPPVEFSKRAVLLKRAREAGLTAVAFVGDDTVDLPAFDALDELSEEGLEVARVAVRWAETPPELIERADVVVDGPTGVLEWLRELLGFL